MKTLLLTGVFIISGFAFGAQVKKSKEVKNTVACTYCTKSGENTYCATAENCNDAKKMMQEIKEMSEN